MRRRGKIKKRSTGCIIMKGISIQKSIIAFGLVET